jgi:hypothetical protein
VTILNVFRPLNSGTPGLFIYAVSLSWQTLFPPLHDKVVVGVCQGQDALA